MSVKVANLTNSTQHQNSSPRLCYDLIMNDEAAFIYFSNLVQQFHRKKKKERVLIQNNGMNYLAIRVYELGNKSPNTSNRPAQSSRQKRADVYHNLYHEYSGTM